MFTIRKSREVQIIKQRFWVAGAPLHDDLVARRVHIDWLGDDGSEGWQVSRIRVITNQGWSIFYSVTSTMPDWLRHLVDEQDPSELQDRR